MSILTAPIVSAQEEGLKPKPVPRLQVIPLPDDRASIRLHGRELTRYHFDSRSHRPFFYPLIGPSGRSHTRMGHPHDPAGHSHHNSFWVSHHIVDGVSFWNDRGDGRIVHERVDRYEDGVDEAHIQVSNLWRNEKTGRVLLRETRRSTVRLMENDAWLLLLDLRFEAVEGDVTLGKTPFGMVGVRMAKTIGVHDGGGRILNSGGMINEKGVFWKPARWVDYSGPITNDLRGGITLMDHPANPNHPSVFHVRDDGWMGASLTYDADRVIKKGEPLRLRYGLYVHGDVPGRETLQKLWKGFSEETVGEMNRK